MTRGEKRIYRQAARCIAIGWSANKTLKSLNVPRGTVAWDAARQGIADMRAFLEMREIYEAEHG